MAQLYGRYYERVLRYCGYRLFSREDVQDVTAEVFLSVARKMRGFRGESEEEFRKWVYAIATNLINSHLRKTRWRSELLAAAVEAGRLGRQDEGERCNEDEIDGAVLQQAILQLKPQLQAIVLMRFFEGMPYEEIAKIMDVKQVTMRVGLTRALKKLRKILPSTIFQK